MAERKKRKSGGVSKFTLGEREGGNEKREACPG